MPATKDDFLELMRELEADEGYQQQTEQEWEEWCEAMDAYHAECVRMGVEP